MSSVNALREEMRPLSKLNVNYGEPDWMEIENLFEAHRLPGPPVRLRDELVNILMWARYGEALDKALALEDKE